MLPLIRLDDMIVASEMTPDETVQLGSVYLYRRGNSYLAHRARFLLPGRDQQPVVALKGDHARRLDFIRRRELLGRVEYVVREGKITHLPARRVSAWSAPWHLLLHLASLVLAPLRSTASRTPTTRDGEKEVP